MQYNQHMHAMLIELFIFHIYSNQLATEMKHKQEARPTVDITQRYWPSYSDVHLQAGAGLNQPISTYWLPAHAYRTDHAHQILTHIWKNDTDVL